MTEREGIEVDYCPECRGVWLDRGELDRIIERAVARDTTSGPTSHERAAAILHREGFTTGPERT